MTRYFWCVDADDFAKRYLVSPGGSLVVKRRSKKSDREARRRFVETLSQHVPVGRKALAWLECSEPRDSNMPYAGTRADHCTMLVTCRGVVTARRKGRDGYSLVPAGGDWIDESGTVIAHAGAVSGKDQS